jgi:hypothetical protein
MRKPGNMVKETLFTRSSEPEFVDGGAYDVSVVVIEVMPG